jgi:N-acetylglutamate synthase
MNHSTSSIGDIRALEERAFNAWPTLETQLIGGWIARSARGYTKRANSINAWQPTIPIDVVIPIGRALYAAHNIPLVVRLSPLAEPKADAILAQDGFAHADESIVMTASLAHAASDAHIEISDEPTDAWINGFCAANRVKSSDRTTLAMMLSARRQKTAFATALSDGKSAGYGMAVVERGMVGLFDIVTVDTARRQGIGWRVVSSLMAWGQRHGAAAAYLQVTAANTPAITMYRAQGFKEAYRYHYRIAPPSQKATPLV